MENKELQSKIHCKVYFCNNIYLNRNVEIEIDWKNFFSKPKA